MISRMESAGPLPVTGHWTCSRTVPLRSLRLLRYARRRGGDRAGCGSRVRSSPPGSSSSPEPEPRNLSGASTVYWVGVPLPAHRRRDRRRARTARLATLGVPARRVVGTYGRRALRAAEDRSRRERELQGVPRRDAALGGRAGTRRSLRLAVAKSEQPAGRGPYGIRTGLE
jgi:hypothetical protein